MTDANDPITPHLTYNEVSGHANGFREGLTKREYFANSAPDIVPEWFKHIEPKKEFDEPKDHPLYATLTETQLSMIHQWQHDPIYDLPEELMWYQDAVNKKWNQGQVWVFLNQEERYFQWRTYYADKLIQELNKTNQ